MSRRRLAVVGASAAGVAAAAAARSAGWDGEILLIGDERDLPYERPPLSKELFGDAVSAPKALLPGARATELGLTLLMGRRVDQLVPHTNSLLLEDGERLDSLTAIVLATGVAPRRLTETADLAGVHVVRDLADARGLAADLAEAATPLVVVGGGYIGLELAAAAIVAGRQVTVIEAAPRLLAHAGAAAVGDWFASVHRARGVDLRLGRVVTDVRADGAGRVAAVVLDDGVEIPAGVLVLGVGSVPRDELAREAGLEVDDGICVGPQGRTSAPDVYAAGDVARFATATASERIEHWNVAQAQGAAAGATAAGRETSWEALPYFWSDQFEYMLQVFGRPSRSARLIERWTRDEGGLWLWLDDERLVAAAGIGCPHDVRAARGLIQRGAVLDVDGLADPGRPVAELAFDR